MSCEQAAAQALKASGHRLTPQRLMILSAVRHAESHITAAEVLEQVKESYPYIDASTVYRTLGILKQMRLVSGTDMGVGEDSYEWMDQPRHHHLVCRCCGRVTLFDNKYVAALRAEILEEYRFRADIDHFAVFGQCDRCQTNTEDT